MNVKFGDKIKHRSYKSVVNEFGNTGWSRNFLGWGKEMTYRGSHLGDIEAECEGRIINTLARLIEDNDDNVFLNQEVI